jgi:hypothetical protein
MKLLTLGGAIALTVFATPAARAACTQADVAGVWASYTVGISTGSLDYWLDCTLRIDASGNFTAKTSSCVADSGLKSPANGHLTLTNGAICAYKGVIRMTKLAAESTINHATLSRDKEAAEGVGLFEDGGFSFNLVRIK